MIESSGRWRTRMEPPMSKNIANWAHLIRDVALALIALILLFEVIVEIASKIANCNVRKLQVQISGTGKNHFRPQRAVRAQRRTHHASASPKSTAAITARSP